MTTTTSYGSWNNHGDEWALTLEQSVTEAFGSFGDEGFDVDAIVGDYRTAINEALPAGVALCGDEFIGPAYDADCDFDGYPTDEDGQLDIATIIEGIDLWKIIARHDHTA